MTDEQPAIKSVFYNLYEKWEEEIKYQSSTDAIANNPFFNKIVNLGKDVIPYIIEVLRDTPGFLIIALHKITGVNPVKPENRGYIKKMSDDWIAWWEQNK
jgi:hypothetical protein